jgi:hypothetical protein
MPTTTSLPVQQLKLDLKNFRTVSQPTEASAISALISINPEWFWALTESILDDGYLVAENILILQGESANDFKVKEGNRRIAILKLCHGYARRTTLSIPSHIEERISKLSDSWKSANALVPCAVYTPPEGDLIERIVQLIHGKGEKAGRDAWGAIAKARHNRDENSASEPGLDLLEKYLKQGKNITAAQKERWAGVYALSVLDEAAKRLAPRLGKKSARELADSYPKISHRDGVETILNKIGLGLTGFDEVRSADFGVALGIPGAAAGGAGTSGSSTGAKGGGGSSGATGTGKKGSKGSKTKAVASNDPRAVRRALKRFSIVGNNREKIVTLREEARKLNIVKTPHAFCFVLRSMFELSAKAYCDDHAKSGGPAMTNKSGEDRKLSDVLRDITKHLTSNNTNRPMVKALHGAMTELGNANGFLSVTSMNQLIHHPKFVVDGPRISTVFANVLPLLEAMNS